MDPIWETKTSWIAVDVRPSSLFTLSKILRDQTLEGSQCLSSFPATLEATKKTIEKSHTPPKGTNFPFKKGPFEKKRSSSNHLSSGDRLNFRECKQQNTVCFKLRNSHVIVSFSFQLCSPRVACYWSHLSSDLKTQQLIVGMIPFSGGAMLVSGRVSSQS